jgi:H/ACA ribonucleoprotein complex subunit 4
VSGVLPITLEDATKATQAFLMSGKEYVSLMQLHEDIKESKIVDVIKEFVGEIYQKPPLRASVKRALRKRVIYDINILEIQNRCVLFKVACEAGTYIRKLCSDIGEIIGSGAHMRELRRTRAGPFTEDKEIVTLYELLDASLTFKEEHDESPLRKVILPVEKAFEYIPKVYIKNSAVNAICHGADLAAPGIAKLNSGINRGDMIALFTLKEEIVAIAKALVSSQKMFDIKFGLMAKTARVIMPVDTYPKLWRKR